MKPVLHLLLGSFLLLSCSAIEQRKNIVIDDILTITDARGTLELLRQDNVAQFRSLMDQAMQDRTNLAYRQRLIETAVEKYADYSKELFSWYLWEKMYVSHYDENFSEAQLRALLAFLKTDAGQAMSRAQFQLAKKVQLQAAEGAGDAKGRIDQIMKESADETEAAIRAATQKLMTAPTSAVEEKARAGDVVAQYLMGTNYAEGKGVEKNSVEAIKWFRMAADQGHIAAKSQLGWFLLTGEGIEKDLGRANDYFTEAAKAGDPMAMYFLGVMLVRGDGVAKDPGQAFPWLLKAANAGHGGAQYEVAVLYWNGTGVEKSLTEAYAWVHVAQDSQTPGADEFDKFMEGRLTGEQVADGMMRSSELRRAIRARNKSN